MRSRIDRAGKFRASWRDGFHRPDERSARVQARQDDGPLPDQAVERAGDPRPAIAATTDDLSGAAGEHGAHGDPAVAEGFPGHFLW